MWGCVVRDLALCNGQRRTALLFFIFLFFVTGVRAGGDERMRLVSYGDVEEARVHEMRLHGTFGVAERVVRWRYLIPQHVLVKAAWFIAGATTVGAIVAISSATGDANGASCPPCPTFLAVGYGGNVSGDLSV